MTFTEIVDDVAERLNLTTLVAKTRVGRVINQRYRWVISSLGLQVSVRAIVTANATIGSRHVTFPNVTKIFSVFNPTPVPPVRLAEVAYDFLRNEAVEVTTTSPTKYAVQIMGASSVIVYISCVPSTAFALSADAESPIATLSGSAIPAFSEDYHDLLIYGAMVVELEKMEKYELAKEQQERFEKRLNDLRVFIGK